MNFDQGAVNIANMALTALGVEMISGFDEKNDPAKLMKMYYPIVLRRILSEYDWNFARRTVDLYEVTPYDEYKNYDYSFALPDNFVAARRLKPDQYFEIYDNSVVRLNRPASRIVQVLQEGSIDTFDDVTQYYVELTFTADAQDAMKFNPGFIQYFAFSLATDTGFMLTGDPGVVNMVTGFANSHQTIAMVEDSTKARTNFEPKEKPYWYMNERDFLTKRYRDGGPNATEDFYQ